MSDNERREPDSAQDQKDLDELSSLYARASVEQPPAAVDQDILRMAAAAVGKEQAGKSPPGKAYGPFTMHWPRFGAVAAMVLLSVILVNTIDRQEDGEFPNGDVPGETLTQSRVPQPQLKAEKKRETAPTVAPDVDAVTEDKPLRKDFSPEARRRVDRTQVDVLVAEGFAAKQDERQALAEALQAQAAVPAEKEQRQEKIAGKPASAERRLNQQPAPLAKAKSKPTAAQYQDRLKQAVSEPQAVGESITTRPKVAAKKSVIPEAEIMAPAREPQAMPGVTLSDENQSVPEHKHSAAGLNRDAADSVATIPNQPLVGAMAPATPLLSEQRDNPSCEELSQLQCLQAGRCTLVKQIIPGTPEHRLVCRAAANNCELGFRQLGDGAQLCTVKEGCVYQAAVGSDPARCNPMKNNSDN